MFQDISTNRCIVRELGYVTLRLVDSDPRELEDWEVHGYFYETDLNKWNLLNSGIASDDNWFDKLEIICIDNGHTWRDSLIIGKEYEVLRSFPDSQACNPMIETKCVDNEVRVYEATRFKEQP